MTDPISLLALAKTGIDLVKGVSELSKTKGDTELMQKILDLQGFLIDLRTAAVSQDS